MNKLELVIENAAEKDLFNLIDYLSQINRKSATRVLKSLYKSFNTICTHPKIGFERQDFTYRPVRFYVVNKRYLIIYSIIENSIHILRVLTTYQDICSML